VRTSPGSTSHGSLLKDDDLPIDSDGGGPKCDKVEFRDRFVEVRLVYTRVRVAYAYRQIRVPGPGEPSLGDVHSLEYRPSLSVSAAVVGFCHRGFEIGDALPAGRAPQMTVARDPKRILEDPEV